MGRQLITALDLLKPEVGRNVRGLRVRWWNGEDHLRLYLGWATG